MQEKRERGHQILLRRLLKATIGIVGYLLVELKPASLEPADTADTVDTADMAA
jgi:hypothetical protein